MDKLNIKVVRLSEKARLPTYGHTDGGDGGADLYSIDTGMIFPGKQRTIGTGISMEIPFGWGGFVWDKSSIGAAYGQKRLGGVIDPNYRGEILVTLHNTTDDIFYFNEGQKIAQIVFTPYRQAEFEEVLSLDETQRGDGAFGSTGL